MFRNYLKTGWRGLVRDRLYSLVNLSGLTVAITVFLLIFLYVQDELSYDRYHPDHENTYRVVSNLTTPGNYFEFALTPPHLGERMQEDFPEVLKQLRLAYFSETLSYGEQSFEEDGGRYADATFFDFFGIPLLQGDTKTALAEPYSIVLTESSAQRYFGDEDPLGKLLQAEGVDQPFVVTGVMAEVPDNTHFDASMLVSMNTREAQETILPGQWFFLDYYTYLKVPEGFNVKALQAKMPDFIEKHIGETQRSVNQSYQFEFQQLKDIHLKSKRDVELAVNGDVQYVRIFSIVAIFILTIACVNFMNLSTARATKRAKEIGVRKVVGAVRRQLVAQFLVESLLISLCAFVLAFSASFLLLDAFNELVSKNLVYTSLFEGVGPYVWMAALTLTGVLAGLYPALFLSGFKPISVLKSSKTVGGGSNFLRKGLVVFQLMISTTLIVGVIVIDRQLFSLQNQNLGFDKERMVVIDYNGSMEQQEVLKAELSQLAAVKQVSFSRFNPRGGAVNWFTEYEQSPGELVNASMFGALVDFDFMDTYGFELLAGRVHNRNIAMDMDSAYVINEAAVKKMGFEGPEQALGQLVGQNGNLGRVIGVVKDFNFRSLHNEIEPLLIYPTNPMFYNKLSVRIGEGDAVAAMEQIRQVWEQVIPDRELEAAFLNDQLKQYYEAELLTVEVFDLFSDLAIFIAALGLFALSTFTAAQQQKATSVRKVLGASTSRLAMGFVSHFIKLSLLAFAISMPLAWLLAESWLSGFPYRIHLDATMVAFTAVFMLLLTLLAVSFQSWRVARSNPATVLRGE